MAQSKVFTFRAKPEVAEYIEREPNVSALINCHLQLPAFLFHNAFLRSYDNCVDDVQWFVRQYATLAYSWVSLFREVQRQMRAGQVSYNNQVFLVEHLRSLLADMSFAERDLMQIWDDERTRLSEEAKERALREVQAESADE